MQNAFESLLATFDEVIGDFEQSWASRFIRSDEFTVDHYASILREIYFYTRDNPQLQAAWTQCFDGSRRTAVRRVLGHALDEVGHDLMAIADLDALGYDTSGIEKEQMLATTLPIVGLPVYEMAQGRGIGYLGQIFFLEFTPTRTGEKYVEALRKAGVKEEAMSFLAEHVAVDVHHNRLMEKHVADLVLDEHDLELCQRAIRTTGYYYAEMLEGAIRAAEKDPMVKLAAMRQEVVGA